MSTRMAMTQLSDSRTGGLEGADPHSAADRLPTGHVLDLPVAPSVNKTRQHYGKGRGEIEKYAKKADALLLAARYRPLRMERFELHITCCEEKCGLDLDNVLKCTIDYLKRVEAIVDDAPANLRRLVVEWGEAPEGVRVSIKRME